MQLRGHCNEWVGRVGEEDAGEVGGESVCFHVVF